MKASVFISFLICVKFFMTIAKIHNYTMSLLRNSFLTCYVYTHSQKCLVSSRMFQILMDKIKKITVVKILHIMFGFYSAEASLRCLLSNYEILLIQIHYLKKSYKCLLIIVMLYFALTVITSILCDSLKVSLMY